MTAAKTANVTARIQPDIKETAEAILERLGIPVSVFIDMTYRQVIMHDGVPFSLEVPNKPVTQEHVPQTLEGLLWKDIKPSAICDGNL